MAESRSRLIAVRRPTARRRERPRRPTGDDAKALRHDFHSEIGAALEDIGLTGVSSLDQPIGDTTVGRFHELAGIDALIVDPLEDKTVEDVRASLGDEYLVMPDIDLQLPGNDAQQSDDDDPIAAADVRPLSEVLPEDSGIMAAHAAGNMGEGVVLAVFDTGIDADHQEFGGQIIKFAYAPPGGGKPREQRRGFDTASHGTHVSGTLHGANIGIAPKSQMIVVSVIESERAVTSASRVLQALQWLQELVGQPEFDDKPVILSMSLGFRPEALSKPDMATTMEALRLVLREVLEVDGILPIVAVGNDGAGTMRAPGYYPESLSVGAVGYDRKPWAKSGGGSAPEPFNTRICPDIAGFGVKVVSATGRDEMGASWYGKKTGTSMATPYVAGIATLTAANTKLEGIKLRDHLLASALPLDGLNPDRVGKGLARCA